MKSWSEKIFPLGKWDFSQTIDPIKPKESFKLYELSDAVVYALDCLIDDENSESIDNALTLLDKFDEKASAVGAYLLNLQTNIESIRSAEERLARKRKSLENHEENLRHYLITQMEKVGKTEVKSSPLFSIKIRENSDSVNVISKAEVPYEYWKVKEIAEVDKMKIKEELKQGVCIPGVELVKRKRLEIK